MFRTFAFAAIAGVSMLAGPAQAEFRWMPPFFWFDDDEERQLDNFEVRRDEEDDIIVMPLKRRNASLYDEELDDYYVPRYEPRGVKKQASAKAVFAAPKKKTVKAPVVAKTQVAKAGVGCDKGVSVVTGYGFKDVKAKQCSGKVLVFTAVRGGKPYEVSVGSLSGDITEVRKVQ